MAGRCGSDPRKRDEALKKNISDFRSDALKLLKGNLPEKYHSGGENELDAYVTELKENGCRMGEALKSPLKHKTFLVDLHGEYQRKETQIDTERIAVFAEPQKTYLHGLELKMKALQEANDPPAADPIKAEIDKVAANPDYFPGLMLAAKKE
jgi:hypothetical protein